MLLLALALTACAGETTRPLTTAESELLALTRFRNFDAGVRSVSFAVTDAGTRYEVDAWVDFPAGTGYGTVQLPDAEESALLAWTSQGVATAATAAAGPAPLPPPTQGWTSSELLPGQSRLHAVLAVLLTLGNDRPDNAVLLAQTDAQWLREDTVTGTDVTVFRGPSSDAPAGAGIPAPPGLDESGAAEVRYWVAEDGLLHRLEVTLGGGQDAVVIDLDNADVTVDLSQLQ